jgi:hypothetical protein
MKPLRAAAVAIVIGSIGLIGLSQKPRFQQFHTVDVLQLTGSGACYGVAMTAIVAAFKRRKQS